MQKLSLFWVLVLGIIAGHSIVHAAPQPLTVMTTQPTGEMQNLTQILVRFSEDMRALGQMEQDAATSPLKLTTAAGPLPAGQFRWLDTATLAYLFEEPVDVPVHITATVNAGTKALSGTALAKAVKWDISTPEFYFSVSPSAGLPPTDASIELRTNYPLDIDSLKARTTLEKDGRPLTISISEAEMTAYASYYGRRANWTYTITIKETLPPDTTLSLNMAPGITFKKGGAPLPEKSTLLSTYQSLRLISWDAYIRDEEDKTMRPENRVQVSFNNPVTLKDVLAHLDVSPRAARISSEEDEDDSTQDDRVSTRQTLPFRWEARTRYTLTLKPGLADRYGTTLSQGSSHSFTTGDFYPMFQMGTADRAMEKPLKGIFPIHIRNMTPITIAVRHFAWNADTFKAWNNQRHHNKALEKITPIAQHTETLDLSESHNKDIRHELNLPDVLGYGSVDAMPCGLTEIAVTVTDPKNKDRHGKPIESTAWATVQITNIGITAKIGKKQGLAWITDITTGQPMANVALSLIDKNGNPAWHGTTDENGIAILPGQNEGKNSFLYLVAQKGSDTSVLNTDGNFSGASYYNIYESVLHGKNWKVHYESALCDENWKVHAITQLPLYQPGQTVNYTLYAKAVIPGTAQSPMDTPDWRPVAGEKIKVTIKDSRRRDIHTQEATTNAYGSVSGSVTLSKEAALGHYTFYLTRVDERCSTTTNAFQVAVFRAPDFKVDIDDIADTPNPPAHDKPVFIRMKAGYFSGAALPGAAAVMKVTKQEEGFTPARLAGYKTGIVPDYPFIRYGGRHPSYQPLQPVAELPATLDAKGITRFALPDIIAASGQPLRVGMEATVTDKSGLTTQGARSFLLHPSAQYVGIRAQRIMLKGQDQRIHLKAATWDNQPLSGVNITLKAERLRGNHQNEAAPKADPVWEKQVALSSADGAALPVQFDKSGTYTLTAIITDEMGRENCTRVTIYVPGPDMDWISTRTGKSLELLTEDIEYTPGETARIIIRNPYYGQPSGAADGEKNLALVTIERDSVQRHFFVDVTGATHLLEINLTEADAPYLYVSVVMVRGRTAAPPAVDATDNRDMGAPWSRHGTTLIRVKKNEPQLAVTIETDEKQYRPGSMVDASVRVTDTTRQARQAQVTLLAVDNRILRAAGEKTAYDPTETFEPVYTYGINSGDTRVMLLNLSQISSLRGGMERRKEKAAGMARNMLAEEFVQDADSAERGQGRQPTLRQNFSPLAHWLAIGETDAAGVLKTRFTLPDTLTSYRIVAIAADKTKQYSVSQADITATKPLQLLSALPRFATEGDRLDARVLVQNTGTKQQTITVTAKPTNMKLDTATQRITLEGGQSGTVTFPARIGKPGYASLIVSGKMGRETDAAEFSFPVMPAAPLTTVAAAGLLKEGETRTLPVSPPAQLDPRSKLAVIFAASPAAGLPLAAEQVIAYPWGCLEQRMSRAWARAIRLEHGALIGLSPDKTDRDAIREALAAAEKFQKYDGGFSLWPGISSSSFYLTTYVLTVNSQTQPLGMALPDDVEQQAYRYIRSCLSASYPDTEKQQRRQPIEAEAMALWLIAQQNPADAQRLYPKILARAGDGKNINPMTWGALLMAGNALPQMPERDQYASDIIRILEKTAQVTPTHLHFAANQASDYWMTMGSTLRDNGMILGALTTVKPDYPRLEALAAWISQGLGNRPMLSTQEAIYGLWGLAGYLKNLGGNQPVAMTATWNDKETMTHRFTRLVDAPQTWTLPADKLGGGQTGGLTLKADQGTPYWTARLAYASPLVPVKDETAGFTVKRTWVKEGSKPGSAANWKMGDIIEVTVTMIVPATRRHVLLFDPFPAGLEPLFATRVDLENEAKRYQAPWQWEETQNDGMLLYSETVHPGTYTYTYKLRAAAPGTFVQRPSYAEEMYTPEVFGRTAGSSVVVTE